MQTRWTTVEGWYEHEVEFDGRRVVYKQWFDSGKDPNRCEIAVHDFVAGRVPDDLRAAFGPARLAGMIETVDRLTSGGPGVGEPPE